MPASTAVPAAPPHVYSRPPHAHPINVSNKVTQPPHPYKPKPLVSTLQDYVPFPPYVEGCYMPQLTLLKLLPDLISTAKAAAAQHPGSLYAAAFSSLTGEQGQGRGWHNT